MKIETLELKKMKILEYMGRKMRERRENARRTNEAYAQLYRNCFEGTPEEVERKLCNWDSVHAATRARTPYSSI